MKYRIIEEIHADGKSQFTPEFRQWFRWKPLGGEIFVYPEKSDAESQILNEELFRADHKIIKRIVHPVSVPRS